jgi:hypothetical protein
MSLRLAQTFYIDKTIVNGAEHVTVDSVDLYFKLKPRYRANRSGIEYPGATIYIMHIKDDDEPDVNRIIDGSHGRREYLEIVASADGSIATTFKFPTPVVLETNKSYAIGVHFDGSEEFQLWRCKEGEFIVKTNTISAGGKARNVGKHWEYTLGSKRGWKALSNIDLKFKIHVCKYGNTSANSVSNSYVLPCDSIEYIMYNRYHPKSTNHDKGKIGEMVFQETPVIYGTLTVSSNSIVINANSNSINFSTLFPASTPGTGTTLTYDPIKEDYQYIVVRNGSTQAANVDVLEIQAVLSNTSIQVARLPKFSTNTATFSLTGAGRLMHRDIHFHTGRWFDYTSNTFIRHVGRKADIMVLDRSNANSTLRFVNNMCESIGITSGGTGYSNSDVITIYPVLNANTANAAHIAYIPSYANCVANVVTNGTGTITGIAISNAGYGLSANVSYTITTTAGTGASLAATIGATCRGAESNAQFSDCVVIDLPLHRAWPKLRILQNQSHVSKVIHHYPYYIMPGTEHILVQLSESMKYEVDILKNNRIINLDFQ